jgi:hypothetical protein
VLYSPVNTRDKHDDNLNRSSLRVQGPPVSTYNRYKTNTIVTSGKNDRNEDTGMDDPDISFSITFLESSHTYERVLFMASSTHLE